MSPHSLALIPPPPWHYQAIHGVTKMLHFLSRQKRFLAASLVVFSTQHVSLRLAWALAHYEQVGVCEHRKFFSFDPVCEPIPRVSTSTNPVSLDWSPAPDCYNESTGTQLLWTPVL